MKIAILTMFNGLDQTYSLVNVVAEHIKMFLDNNINTTIIVSESMPEDGKYGIFKDPRLKWIKITNSINGKQFIWHDYNNSNNKLHDTFYEEMKVISKDFEEKLNDFDICIMHDILFQGWHYIHNIAIRRARKKLPKLRFISFIHSLPDNRPPKINKLMRGKYKGMKNTIFAYPTETGLKQLSTLYNININKCFAINNSLSLLENMSPEVQQLEINNKFMSSEVLIVYPARLTPSKKFEKISALAGSIKKISNKNVKVIFCDFESIDINPQTYKNIIINTGLNYGLKKEDIIFTSNYGFPNGIPRKIVLELFSLSNLYICPSYSESFGLTVLEAASKGNFLVLNKRVPALEELGKKLNTYFMCWDARNIGFNTTETYYPSEEKYYLDNAKIIIDNMKKNPVIISKTITRINYSSDYIFNNQFLPLLTNKNIYN